jgi:hypothetical protein
MLFTLLALLAAGCASQSGKPSPSLTKESPPLPPMVQAPSSPPPRQAGDRPVWVLPVFSTGYVAGAANESDVYVGPHSVTSMVEPGHWASREEAELQGKPYLIPSSNRIVYPGTGSSDTLRRGAGEMDVAASTRRPIRTASSNTNATPETTPAPTPTPGNQTEPPLPSDSPMPQTMPELPSTSPTPTSAAATKGFQVISNTRAELIFTGGQVGENYSVDLASGKKIAIKYLSSTEVQVTAGNTSRNVTIHGLDSRVKVRMTTE